MQTVTRDNINPVQLLHFNSRFVSFSLVNSDRRLQIERAEAVQAIITATIHGVAAPLDVIAPAKKQLVAQYSPLLLTDK